MDELKQCQKCKGDAHLVARWGMWFCGCYNCDLWDEGETAREAIEAWNRREGEHD